MSVTNQRTRRSSSTQQYAGDAETAWVRPAEWLTLPSVEGQQRFAGLFRVDDQSSFVAVQAQGAYTVDWGDGSVVNYASAAAATKQYTYSSISPEGESALGYRQVIIQVYPQGAGNITNLNIAFRNGAGNNLHAIGWLEYAINLPNATTLTLSTVTNNLALLQRAVILSHNSSNMNSWFDNCWSLKSVQLPNNAVTSVGQTFRGCSSLATPPMFNTASVTNFSGLFNGCISLKAVPHYNTASATSMASMFSGCSSLTSVPLFNTAQVTDASSMFANCVSLQSVPLFNTSNCLNMSSMFSGTPVVTVPAFDTAKVTNMSSMFSNCGRLRYIPLFNTALVTTMASMFLSARLLGSVPLLNTAAVTTMNSMCSGATSLVSLPAFNMAAVTNVGGIVTNCGSLSRAPLSGTNTTISFAGLRLGPAALNEIYTGLSATGAGKTITVTGNWGTASHTPSIATAKGWTVTV